MAGTHSTVCLPHKSRVLQSIHPYPGPGMLKSIASLTKGIQQVGGCSVIIQPKELCRTKSGQNCWCQVKHDLAKLQLTSPVCTKEQEKIALSRRVEKHWRLIGYALTRFPRATWTRIPLKQSQSLKYSSMYVLQFKERPMRARSGKGFFYLIPVL